MVANILSSIGSGITMIAIPWLLIQGTNGDKVLGYTTMAVTFIFLVTAPYLGLLIDTVSRKKLLLIGEVIGGTMVAIFTIIGFMGFEPNSL